MKKHYLFKKGVEKLDKELDIVNLIKQIRKLKLMTKILFSSRQAMLLKFQRKNLIETTTSSSDSDHYKYDTLKLMNSNKPLLQLSQYVKIKRKLRQFQRHELEMHDKRLLNGIWMKKPKILKQDQSFPLQEVE